MRDDPAARLGWGARRYWWLYLLVPCMALVGLGVGGMSSATSTYEARALIAATEVNLRGAELPALIAAVFDTSAVAELAVEGGDLPHEPQALIPDYASVEPLGDGLTARVTGRAADPDTAARTANAAAEALDSELGRLGSGVASFQVHDPARPPSEPMGEPLGTTVSGAIGGALGLFLATAILGVIMAGRRPVTHPRELPSIVDLPIVGAVTLGARAVNGRDEGLVAIEGVRPLARRILPETGGVVVVAGVPGDAEVRARVAISLGCAAADLGHEAVVVTREPSAHAWHRGLEGSWADERRGGELVVTRTRPEPEAVTRTGQYPITTILDAGQVEASSVGYLVVSEGVARYDLELVTAQHPSAALAGVIWVARARRRWHHVTASSGSGAGPVQQRRRETSAAAPSGTDRR